MTTKATYENTVVTSNIPSPVVYTCKTLEYETPAERFNACVASIV